VYRGRQRPRLESTSSGRKHRLQVASVAQWPFRAPRLLLRFPRPLPALAPRLHQAAVAVEAAEAEAGMAEAVVVVVVAAAAKVAAAAINLIVGSARSSKCCALLA
jgi:hypothetical protein